MNHDAHKQCRLQNILQYVSGRRELADYPLSIRNCIPLRKSLSEIIPVDHQLALLLNQLGIPFGSDVDVVLRSLFFNKYWISPKNTEFEILF